MDSGGAPAYRPPWHCVVFHKQKTSARTRFLSLSRDVVFPPGLEEADALSDGEDPELPGATLLPHPAAGLGALADHLGLPAGSFRVEAGHLGRVLGEAPAPVWLVEVLTIDPPAVEALPAGARFISILEARLAPAPQRELLRRAYERILG